MTWFPFEEPEGTLPDGVQVDRLGGGGNSRVYRVERGGERWVVKAFMAHPGDHRDRFDSESRALALLAGQHVPRLLATDGTRRWVAMTWVDGVRPAEPTVTLVDQALGFLKALQELGRTLPPEAALLASEASFSLTGIQDQILARLERLQEVAHPGARAWVTGCLKPAVQEAVLAAEDLLGTAARLDLPQGFRWLSPSDFGFHNALLQPDGTLVFVDFEHFGWDDPVKLAADVALHPGMSLNRALGEHFRCGIQALADPGFGVRHRAFHPLFGLKWCCILLNEFLPHHQVRRKFAGADAVWHPDAQLEKAHALLDRLRREHVLAG